MLSRNSSRRQSGTKDAPAKGPAQPANLVLMPVGLEDPRTRAVAVMPERGSPEPGWVLSSNNSVLNHIAVS